MSGLILGIETSCDDTAVALVDPNSRVIGSLFANQDMAHAPFGGVVPELASRRHTENLLPLLERLMQQTGVGWEDISAIAVTSRPGLIGSLLVGVVTAKTLALAKNKPLIGINHIEGHLFAPFLKDESYQPPDGFGFPFLGLAVSGGHTHLFLVKGVGQAALLGQTRDDAAGEAFDKFAKQIGLGFPGGARVDREAQTGNPIRFPLPRALLKEDGLDFSFSGLKSAALRLLSSMPTQEVEAARADLCASFQAAVVDVLLHQLGKATQQFPEVQAVAITGGVSANTCLRTRAGAWAAKNGRILALPPARYCTDNAAMIAVAGLLRYQAGLLSDHDLSPSAASLAGDFSL